MRVFYSANGISGWIGMTWFDLDNATAESLAELAAIHFWQSRPDEVPPDITLVHLQDVEGKDLGIFEVRREMQPVFTALPLPGEG